MPPEISLLLDRSESYVEQNRRADKKQSLLRGRTIINLFFETSTRTRTSFELAGKRLGADVINMSVSTVVGAQGRDADRHGDDAERHAPRRAGRPPPGIRRGQAAVAEGQLRGDQRRRRQPRASDPGAARRAHHPPAEGPAGRAEGGDLRRHPALPRRALEHPPAEHHGRPRPGGGAADADAARQSSGWASRCSTTWARASTAATS